MVQALRQCEFDYNQAMRRWGLAIFAFAPVASGQFYGSAAGTSVRQTYARIADFFQRFLQPRRTI